MNEISNIVSVELYKMIKMRSVLILVSITVLAIFALKSQSFTQLTDHNSFFGIGGQKNPWHGVVSSNNFSLTIIVSLLSCFFPVILLNMEYRDNAVKLVACSPVSGLAFFLAKFSSVSILFLIFVLLCGLSNSMGIYYSGINRSDQALLGHSFSETWGQQLYYMMRLFISQLGCMSLLLIVGFKVSNLPFFLAITFVFWLCGMVVPSFANYFPSKYPIWSVFVLTAEVKVGGLWTISIFKYEILSVLTCVLCFIAAFLFHRKSKLLILNF